MILLQKDYSAGWMDVLINFATGLKTNQTTSGGRTASTLSGHGMGTCGMTCIAQPVISTRARKVNETAAASHFANCKDAHFRNPHSNSRNLFDIL